MAVVDVCSRRGILDPRAAVSIPLSQLAEQVIDLYWQQARPHQQVAERSWSRLRQESGESPVTWNGASTRPRQARILRAVEGLRAVAAERGWTTPGQVRVGAPDQWRDAVERVAEALAKQPIPRLQRPGTSTGATYEAFLYDDSSFGEGVSRRRALELSVDLRAGWRQPW